MGSRSEIGSRWCAAVLDRAVLPGALPLWAPGCWPAGRWVGRVGVVPAWGGLAGHHGGRRGIGHGGTGRAGMGRGVTGRAGIVRGGGTFQGVGLPGETDTVTFDHDPAVTVVEAPVVASAEQHRVADRQLSIVGVGVRPVGDIAPRGRSVAAWPDAPTVTDLERTPQPLGNGADLAGHIQGGAVSVQDHAHELTVSHQVPQGGPTDGLP